MSEPLTWTAIQQVAALLATIDGADGWHTDLGAHPILLDRTQQPDTGAPFTVVIADEIATAEGSQGRSRRTLTGEVDLIIEFAISASGKNPEMVAHRARADIVRALTVEDLRGRAPGITKISVQSTRITDAVLAGTDLVIAQVLARADLVETLTPA